MCVVSLSSARCAGIGKELNKADRSNFYQMESKYFLIFQIKPQKNYHLIPKNWFINNVNYSIQYLSKIWLLQLNCCQIYWHSSTWLALVATIFSNPAHVVDYDRHLLVLTGGLNVGVTRKIRRTRQGEQSAQRKTCRPTSPGKLPKFARKWQKNTSTTGIPEGQHPPQLSRCHT